MLSSKLLLTRKLLNPYSTPLQHIKWRDQLFKKNNKPTRNFCQIRKKKKKKKKKENSCFFNDQFKSIQ